MTPNIKEKVLKESMKGVGLTQHYQKLKLCEKGIDLTLAEVGKVIDDLDFEYYGLEEHQEIALRNEIKQKIGIKN